MKILLIIISVFSIINAADVYVVQIDNNKFSDIYSLKKVSCDERNDIEVKTFISRDCFVITFKDSKKENLKEFLKWKHFW